MSMPTEPVRFRYIDALRGIAILGVLAYHLAIANSVHGPLGKYLFSGARGVQLFFVVSAFTLYLSLDYRKRGERNPLGAYIVRRLFRIVPLYHLALVAILCYRGLGPRAAAPDGLAWWDVVLAALFLNGWHPYRFSAFVPGGWSIITEVYFYLVLPWVHSCVRTVWSACVLLLLSLIVAFSARWAILAAFPREDQEYVVAFSYMNFAAQAPVFALGILCYFVLLRDRASGARARKMWPGMVGAAMVAALVLPFAPIGEFESCLVYGVVCALLLLGLHHYPLPALVNRFTLFWGVHSYSAYIAHPGVMHVLEPLRKVLIEVLPIWLAATLWSVLVLAGVAAAAHLLHRMIEEPGRRLGARLIQKLGAGPASAPATT